MFRRTAVARLRCTPIARGVAPFVMYLIRSKGKHTGMPATERAKKVAAEYRALSPTKLAELRKAGSAHKTLPKGWRMREAEKKENKDQGHQACTDRLDANDQGALPRVHAPSRHGALRRHRCEVL
jgi:hypothetical protein